MSENEEFPKCPECKVGNMRPTGERTVNRDPATGAVKDEMIARKCDNCGHPKGGSAKAVNVNEGVGVKDSMSISSTTTKEDDKTVS